MSVTVLDKETILHTSCVCISSSSTRLINTHLPNLIFAMTLNRDNEKFAKTPEEKRVEKGRILILFFFFSFVCLFNETLLGSLFKPQNKLEKKREEMLIKSLYYLNSLMENTK